MDTAIQVVSLALAAISMALAIVAICLSLYFYRRSLELDVSTKSALSDIRKSSKVTEIASKDLLHPVIDTVLGIVRQTTQSQLESSGQVFMHKAAVKLGELLKADTEEQKAAARSSFIKEINRLLGTLRHEVGKIGLVPEPETEAPVKTITAIPARVTPRSPLYDWTSFISTMKEMQDSNKFLSVKWLMEKRFAEAPKLQEALQAAIDKKILRMHFIDNPRKPEFPTLCCKLNEDNKIVMGTLESIARAGELTEESKKG